MKRIPARLALFMLLLLSLICCKDDDEAIPAATIYHSWLRVVTDTQGLQFNAELQLHQDNTLDFIVLDTGTGHTNSSTTFTLEQDTMTLAADPQCNTPGRYVFLVSETRLALVAVSDTCVPRKAAMQGIWTKK